jgi:hypothetical protein
MKQSPSNLLLETLKRHCPAKVRAYAGDDDVRDIAVPSRRRRWGQVIEAIQARAWSRVELIDKSGAVLSYVENAEPARELEPLDAATSATGGQVLLAERIVGLVARGQREVMTFRDAELSALLSAQGSVVREMADAMRSLSALYREQVQTAEHTAELRATAHAQAAAGGDDQVRQLLEALPVILQALPMLRGLLGAGAPAPAAAVNGKAKG